MNTVSPLSHIHARLGHTNHFDNLSTTELIEKAVLRREGTLTHEGALRVSTGAYTGRSPKDKFIVADDTTNKHIHWGAVNQSMSPDTFTTLHEKVLHYLATKDCFVFNGYAGADKTNRLPIQVINEYAWHNLFCRQLFIEPTTEERHYHQPSFTIISAPTFKADPELDGTHSEAFIIISFAQRVILIGGTQYAGEIKKAVFSVMNALLPAEHVLPMHCAANIGRQHDTALFFGLSGTGKTTLSADPERQLIGDDEHGWSENGIFNIEGGCYAKCIHLSAEKEPQIWQAIGYGTVLENVCTHTDSRIPDYDNTSLTENTRAAYHLNAVEQAIQPSIGGHPQTIIFLTADATGILPPISLLSKEQAMYHFLSGYTSKLAGTERGISTPHPTFSACYAEPFLPLHPTTYADLLGEKITEQQTRVFLINTGWTGGPYGSGQRINLTHTRAMVTAALNGNLEQSATQQDDVFGLHILEHCPGVPDDILQPRQTWDDPDAYDKAALALAQAFKDNFRTFWHVSDTIHQAGPK